MTRFLLALFVLYSFPLFCQVDPAKADSLARAISASQKTVNAYQDSFKKAQDSIYRSEISKGQPGHSTPATSLSAELKKEKQKKERQLYIRWGLTALLLVLLVIGWRCVRKKSNQS
jgi:hypothetical protein